MRQEQNGAEDRLCGLTVMHLAQPVEGGVARVVADLADAQVRQGARVVVACPPGGTLGAEAAARGARVVPWAARRPPGTSLAAETRAAAHVLGSVRPDLLHLHSAKAGLAGRLAARGRVPTVFQPHAWSYEAVRGPVGAAAVRWERYAARWAHRVLCVSAAERDRGLLHGVLAEYAVVPNGVDTERFRPPRDRVAARAALPALTAFAATPLPVGPTVPGQPLGHPRPGATGGARDGTPLVVCVGRLCPQKGQDVLLRAWPRVTERLPAARLALVGDGPDLPRLLRDAPDGVLFAGPAADPLPWYQAADVAVQPSRWEGMALAPLEAMACGVPVVATDVAGARESAPPDGGGAIVPPGDPAALAAALLVLLTAPARRAAAGRRALDHVRAHHDVRAATAAVSALYADLLPRPISEASAR
ncbi:glycosyltransferase [Actinacidiphila yeochonensis]|uniref:glycosyltransferase n=1 Tax=Actinacidiphila yeochonensis TaxID=89050 RepID=UPI00068D846C|nr:glycosyltransferase [Actinacidiphila yeochonensis]